MQVSMLTTTDNPYDPFDQFDEWFAFDGAKGYYTLSLLARVVVTSDELSDADQRLAINKAIDTIVSNNFSGMHTKVTREVSNKDGKMFV